MAGSRGHASRCALRWLACTSGSLSQLSWEAGACSTVPQHPATCKGERRQLATESSSERAMLQTGARRARCLADLLFLMSTGPRHGAESCSGFGQFGLVYGPGISHRAIDLISFQQVHGYMPACAISCQPARLCVRLYIKVVLP